MEHLNITTEILELAEARRRLPEVRAHVTEVMKATEQFQAIQARLSVPRGTLTSAEETALKDELHALDARFRTALKSMNDLGAYLKDASSGLIDFYSWMDGELVFLCWKHPEDELAWWHRLDEGFAGRKPLPSP